MDVQLSLVELVEVVTITSDTSTYRHGYGSGRQAYKWPYYPECIWNWWWSSNLQVTILIQSMTLYKNNVHVGHLTKN